MTILDTNVVSALLYDPPPINIVAWLDRQAPSSIWTTSITVLEIQTGLRTMPVGKRQTGLSQVFERILDGMSHRIFGFDEDAARLAANLNAERQKKGRIGEIRDTMIAGIVLAHRASLATRNTSHFDDIAAVVIDPWIA
ncbi:MAG TPA: PIN domain-containing protein [Candidatus Sulfotelmatobacter sp.]|nr:PIN domain-containing protein [Candidatus Sulfotelmatobacter sp.]